MRTFKKGDVLRTTYKGPRRDQVFKLDCPVGKIGGSSGGHWWVIRPIQGSFAFVVLVDNCPRVSPSEQRRMKLKWEKQNGR